MKIIAYGDAHLDAKVGGYDMINDIEQALKHIDSAIIEGDFDLRVMLGDVFHGNRPTPKAWMVFNEHLFYHPMPTIVVRGNHDHVACDPIGVMFLGKTDVALKARWKAGGGEPGLTDNLLCCPRWPCVVEPIDGCKVLVVPYMHNPAAIEEFGRTAQELVDLAFEQALEMGDEIKAAFCHLDVDGAKAGTEGAYLRGGKLQAPMDIVKKLPFPVVNGHIHRKQTIGDNLFLPGSLVPTDFGDADGPSKGYAVLEV